MKRYRSRLSLILAGGAALIASGCSGESIETAGENIIEGEIADLIGQELVAACPTGIDNDVGTTFRCKATTLKGEVIDIAGVVDAEDHIDLQTTNLITADGLVEYERTGAEVLEPEINFALEIDCGVELIVLPDSNKFTCEGSDEFGNTAPIIFTVTDPANGIFEVIIGSAE